jgi:hypothetical protein
MPGYQWEVVIFQWDIIIIIIIISRCTNKNEKEGLIFV